MRQLLGAAFLLALLAAAGAQDQRQPGTLLLNMLIKNEAEHLSRSLPKWAPLIDYWIVGIGKTSPRSVPSRLGATGTLALILPASVKSHSSG
jgi:hypothetical protein